MKWFSGVNSQNKILYNDYIKILHFHGPKPTFSSEQFKTFPFPTLVTPYFNEMVEKFNQIIKSL